MARIGLIAVAIAVGLLFYTYVAYPLLLKGFSLVRGRYRIRREDPPAWPLISITVPMYNEEAQAAELVESLLAIDYPPDRRQILIVSDGSTDRTEQIVRDYADRGVELLAMPVRSGKTGCENAASPRLRGEVIVNTDASIRIRPDAVKRLVRALGDERVGLASGRDLSVSEGDTNVGESGYVGYEMWIRDQETSLYGIVGASGCLYAIRTPLHLLPVPSSLSRDFSAALKCEGHGFRAVSVPDAICLVPRTASIRSEYQRKVRTITRGMETLHHNRALLNPVRHGTFAWMLVSHKVLRWAAPWSAALGAVGLALLAPARPWVLLPLGACVVVSAMGCVGWALGDGRRLPRPVQIAAFALTANLAAMHAFLRAAHGDRDPMWEPTRRSARVAEIPATGVAPDQVTRSAEPS